jgi:hypothetical protein
VRRRVEERARPQRRVRLGCGGDPDRLREGLARVSTVLQQF